MRNVLLILCGCLLLAPLSLASADFMVFSGETYLARPGYFRIWMPCGESFDTIKLFDLDYRNIGATDSIAYDFASREFRVYRSITPYDLVILHDDFKEYSVYYDTAIYDEDTMLFNVGVDINDMNAVMAFTYVGYIAYGEFLNISGSGGIPNGQDSGTISGRVWINIAGHTDLSVLNATISLQGTAYTTVSDANGHFSLAGVPPGTYTLAVTAPDLVPLSKEITLLENQVLEAELPQMTVLKQEDLDQGINDAIETWDVGADRRIGLGEAIQALQVISGAGSN